MGKLSKVKGLAVVNHQKPTRIVTGHFDHERQEQNPSVDGLPQKTTLMMIFHQVKRVPAGRSMKKALCPC